MEVYRFLIEYFIKDYKEHEKHEHEPEEVNFGPFKLLIFKAVTGTWGDESSGDSIVTNLASFKQMVVETGDTAYMITFGKYKVAVMLRNPEKWIGE